MKIYLLLFPLLFGCLPIPSATAQEKNGAMTIQAEAGKAAEPIEISEFAWMAGSWKGTGLGGDCVETWSVPMANTMVGSFLYTQKGTPVFSEHFALNKKGDSLTLRLKHFDEKLVGWEEKDKFVEFPFLKRDGNKFYFSGLTYVQVDKNRMDVFVLMKGKQGEQSEAKFEFSRTE